MTVQRGEKGRWTKGSSGNPSGARKMTDEEKAQRDEAMRILRAATKDAAQALVQIVKSKTTPERVKLQAANVILERVMGKPKETIEADVRATMTAEDMSVIRNVAERLKQKGGEDGGAAEDI